MDCLEFVLSLLVFPDHTIFNIVWDYFDKSSSSVIEGACAAADVWIQAVVVHLKVLKNIVTSL